MFINLEYIIYERSPNFPRIRKKYINPHGGAPNKMTGNSSKTKKKGQERNNQKIIIIIINKTIWQLTLKLINSRKAVEYGTLIPPSNPNQPNKKKAKQKTKDVSNPSNRNTFKLINTEDYRIN